MHEDLPEKKEKNPENIAKKYWKMLGPGFITGAADDDPSGIATYSQAGASHGFSFLWLSLFSFPLMAVMQEMCARIGLVTGVGLAANIKKHYSKKVLYFCAVLLLFANVFNIGADLGAMAKSTQLIFSFLPFSFLVLFFAGFSLFLQIFVPYKQYVKYLKYLTFVLLAYVFTAFFVKINWLEVLERTIIPNFYFSKNALILICAVLGTTISPYLFFWQTSQEVEEEVLKGENTIAKRRENNSPKDIKNMRIDVWSGMFISNLIMFFIIVTCAVTLYSNGITDITSASEAANALRPFAGNFAFVFFALGIIGTGLLAIPVLAGSASYALSESFGKREGLYRGLKHAVFFYGVIIIAMILGVVMNFIGLHPIRVLVYSAVLNGIISPIMIYFIIRLSEQEKIMGEYKNSRVVNFVGWLTFTLVSFVSVGTVIVLFF